MGITISEIKDKYEILLHKANGEVIGQLFFSTLITDSRSMNECNTITLEIKKNYINQINKVFSVYSIYDEIRNERLISLDGYKYVIKEINEDTKNNIKTITAYSKEKKLEKNNISVEDLGFYLQDKDEENGIYSLDEHLYDETGWRFGHIDDVVKYNSDNSPKMRWQESIDMSWLDYLKKNVSTQFNCYVHFDNKNNLVDLYDMESFGENLNIALSYDNYIKSLEKSTSSSDIVTKLKLVGNEEYCVVSESTVTGEDYIENYSYFINSNEMSSDLAIALDKYYETVGVRQEQWRNLRDTKVQHKTELTDKKNREKVLLEEMRVLETNINFYESKVGTDEDLTGTFTKLLAEAIEEFNKRKSEEEVVYARICELELNIKDIDNEMSVLNTLCKKKTATDINDNLIFTNELLDELKEFVFSETFVDDSYYVAEELIESGQKKLSIICEPTRTWDISVEDFTRRLVTNNFRQQWTGSLGLGDVICLYDKINNIEEFIYLVAYEKDFRSKSLSLTLSNKKESESVIRYINDFLKLAKSDNKLMVKNRRLLNDQKYNRINISRDEVM